jgi:hypothetical protein
MIRRSSILRSLTGPLLVLAFTGLTLYTPAALETLEGGIYGYGSKLLLKNSSFHQDEILLVEMDDLEDSRKRIGLLTDALDRGGARVIGLQIPIHQKQPNPALMEIRAFRERFNNYAERRKERVLYPWVVENLGKLEESVDYDSILLKSVRRSGKVVLMADEPGEKGSETGGKRRRRKSTAILWGSMMTQPRKLVVFFPRRSGFPFWNWPKDPWVWATPDCSFRKEVPEWSIRWFQISAGSFCPVFP